MGLGAGEPGGGGLGGLRRQRLHQLDRLGDVAGVERRLRRGRAWPRRCRPPRRRRPGGARSGPRACRARARRRNRRRGRRPAPLGDAGNSAASAWREATPSPRLRCRVAITSRAWRRLVRGDVSRPRSVAIGQTQLECGAERAATPITAEARAAASAFWSRGGRLFTAVAARRAGARHRPSGCRRLVECLQARSQSSDLEPQRRQILVDVGRADRAAAEPAWWRGPRCRAAGLERVERLRSSATLPDRAWPRGGRPRLSRRSSRRRARACRVVEALGDSRLAASIEAVAAARVSRLIAATWPSGAAVMPTAPAALPATSRGDRPATRQVATAAPHHDHAATRPRRRRRRAKATAPDRGRSAQAGGSGEEGMRARSRGCRSWLAVLVRRLPLCGRSHPAPPGASAGPAATIWRNGKAANGSVAAGLMARAVTSRTASPRSASSTSRAKT